MESNRLHLDMLPGIIVCFTIKIHMICEVTLPSFFLPLVYFYCSNISEIAPKIFDISSAVLTQFTQKHCLRHDSLVTEVGQLFQIQHGYFSATPLYRSVILYYRGT